MHAGEPYTPLFSVQKSVPALRQHLGYILFETNPPISVYNGKNLPKGIQFLDDLVNNRRRIIIVSQCETMFICVLLRVFYRFTFK